MDGKKWFTNIYVVKQAMKQRCCGFNFLPTQNIFEVTGAKIPVIFDDFLLPFVFLVKVKLGKVEKNIISAQRM